jgi:hypothetical protein
MYVIVKHTILRPDHPTSGFFLEFRGLCQTHWFFKVKKARRGQVEPFAPFGASYAAIDITAEVPLCGSAGILRMSSIASRIVGGG